MTRKTFKTYLRKVQKLQVLAYDNGLNYSFGTRDAKTKAWITGYVYPEGGSFVEDVEGDDYIYFYFYNWKKVSVWDAELARVEKWILEHSNNMNK